MSYEIKTIEYHKNELKQIDVVETDREKRNSDMDDSSLSRWSSNSVIIFNQLAIKYLEEGLAFTGTEKPYAKLKMLLDKNDNIVAKEEIMESSYGKKHYKWKLLPEYATLIGRKTVPAGSNSRIQKKLELKEERKLAEIQRGLVARCAHIGSPISFHSRAI